MAGFLKKLFGRRDTGGSSDGGKTKQLSRPAATGKLPSPQMSKPRGSEGPDSDTGPWYIGKTVADIFEIRGVLGRGGMGIVYQAHDNATQRKVAIKVPLGKFVDDEDARNRFTREAEAWTGLIHPHIVHAFDVRDDQTTDYRPAIFMDYCDGGSLADRIYSGQRPSMTEALDIAIQICWALDIAVQVCWAMEFAHEKGHVHRDLKPGNVLLTSEGKALVTDFGLVKMLEAEDLGLDSGRISRIDAQVLASISDAGGTPEYMPPEQWEGKAEKRSDIYAFGVMLYEMFCGCRPFTAENCADLWTFHMKVPPPDPKQFNGDIPDVLAELMPWCLAKKPSARPPSFCDLVDMLLKAYSVAAERENLPTKYPRPKPQARDISRANKEARAWALTRLGQGCHRRGDLSDTQRHYAKAKILFQELGDKWGMGVCYAGMGIMAGSRGEYDEAMELSRKSLAIYEELGDKWGMGLCYTVMGSMAANRGQYDEAIEVYRKNLDIYEDLGDKAGMGVSYACIADLAANRGNYDEAMELYSKNLDICEDLGNKAGMGVCYADMGSVAANRGNYDEAMELYRKSLAICEDLGDKARMGGCYVNIASVAANRAQYDEAMKLYRKSLAIMQQLGDKAGMGGCYAGMGKVAVNRGQYDEAMELYHKNLAICEELGDKAGMGGCYEGMGVVAANRGEYDEAMELSRKNLTICEELGNKAGMGVCYTNMGNLAQNRGQYDEALELSRKSLAIKQELGNKAGMGKCYTNIGNVAAIRGHYDEAMELYHKDLAICEELDDKAGVGRCYTNMGVVAIKQGQYDEAMKLGRKSLIIYEELGDAAGMGRCYTNMAVLAQMTGDHRNGRAYALKAVKLSDGVGIPVNETIRQYAGM